MKRRVWHFGLMGLINEVGLSHTSVVFFWMCVGFLCNVGVFLFRLSFWKDPNQNIPFFLFV